MIKEQTLFGVEEYKANFKTKKGKREESVQIAVCNYLKAKYPDVIFTCDLASGMKLPIHIGARHKKMRSSRGLPDLFIAKPKTINEVTVMPTLGPQYYHKKVSGLFIEIKQESVRLKSGGIQKSPHHDEQAAILDRLTQLGYKAVFGCGVSECIKIIDEYLGNK